MKLRLIELIAPAETIINAQEMVAQSDVIGTWKDDISDGRSQLRVLLDVDNTEEISDTLRAKFGDAPGFRLMLFNVEATLPLPQEKEEDELIKEEAAGRISRDELYTDVTNASQFTWVYISMLVLSTFVAAAGLIYNDIVAIIGAMVIAPLMGPNVALALAVTLADDKLGLRSLKTNMSGLGIVFAISFLIGLFGSFDPGGKQFLSHTAVTFGDLFVSIAAGAAGVLAYTVGVPGTIIGVAVALALLPALVSFGLLLGAGYTQLAVGSLILTITNLISINLSGVVTFLIQGVHPRNWWEEKKARHATRIALTLWIILLGGLVVSIWYWGQLDLKAMLPQPLK